MPQWLKVSLLSAALIAALGASYFAGWCTTNVVIVPKKPAPQAPPQNTTYVGRPTIEWVPITKDPTVPPMTYAN